MMTVLLPSCIEELLLEPVSSCSFLNFFVGRLYDAGPSSELESNMFEKYFII